MKQNFEVLFNPEVYEDIQDVLDYFHDITHDYELGVRFLDAVANARRALRKALLQYQIRYDNIRFFQIHPFSHIIHFSVDEAHNLIKVLAILHSSDDPGKWTRHKKQ